MTVLSAHAPMIEIKNLCGSYQVLDAAASVSFGREVLIGQYEIIRGFVHYSGAWRSAHEGVTAVIRPDYYTEEGNFMMGDPVGALEKALQEGLRNGRDDRK